LPSDGSVTLSSVNLGGFTMTGGPALAAGDVVVSGQGNGFLRKVTSVSGSGAAVNVQTSAATLGDVFQQAQIDVSKTLAPSDYVVLQSDVAGLTVTTGTPPAVKGADTSTPQVLLNFNDVMIKSSDGTNVVDLRGSEAITLDVEMHIKVDSQGVESATFLPKLRVSGAITVGEGSGDFSPPLTPMIIAYLVGKPITVQVGPVPVVVTPYIILAAQADGHIQLGILADTNGTTTTALAAHYSRGAGWSQTDASNLDLAALPSGSSTNDQSFRVDPIIPTVLFDIGETTVATERGIGPQYSINVTHSGTPPHPSVDISADFGGSLTIDGTSLNLGPDYVAGFHTSSDLYFHSG